MLVTDKPADNTDYASLSRDTIVFPIARNSWQIKIELRLQDTTKICMRDGDQDGDDDQL